MLRTIGLIAILIALPDSTRNSQYPPELRPPTRHPASRDGDLPHEGGGEKRPRTYTSPLVGEVVAERSEATGGGLLPSSPPPNVLIILADDMGFSDLGCYG